VTEVNGTATTFAGSLFANVSTPLTLGMTCSCIDISTLSVSVLEGLSNPVRDDVRLQSVAATEGNEEEDSWADVEIVDCRNSELENNES
jgi:hypothetical protein